MFAHCEIPRQRHLLITYDAMLLLDVAIYRTLGLIPPEKSSPRYNSEKRGFHVSDHHTSIL